MEEYSASEQQQYLVTGMFKALLDATSQNGQISPANFDQIAFENSDAYSVRDEVHEYNDQYFEAKEVQKEIRKAKAEQERIENMAWYEKVWEYGSTFVGEISGYYDYVRVKDGIDPITGEKLSEAERITSGAMAAATYVPFVGWGAKLGKGVKGAYAVGKTMRMTNATIDTYKTAKTMDYLHKAEYGIYGLTSANGFSEYITGKDMFGNELSEEKRKEGLDMAMSFWGSRVAGVGVKKASTHLNLNQVEKNRKVSTGVKGTGEVGWNMSKGGGEINGRKYSQHALERMAPDIPEIKATLTSRAIKKAEELGFKPQTKEFSDFVKKYVDPRNIPPSVIEDAIMNTKKIPGNRSGRLFMKHWMSK
ncbi:pre-toxin TG domain-containing protein [Virgibacillus sp. 179-BFC.A HS]|uniref:Pre-toxin TG domain-containing protein n=1 Tax=Tigheibacillus jepli TaxID=3035914 RepID=A0ABU5CFQ0_9BACI|nr:pre-toxin TG domain-containing protein [Virgibacillus sp. 179-BFC.A HS]MDY0404697.1 pre-toxin TG domain-containing protein [Virgibacillus sp. 179-BFC.A HS]